MEKKGSEYLANLSLTRYICNGCGAFFVKLWRAFCSDTIVLFCANCASKDQNEKIKKMDKKGCHRNTSNKKTDQIGGFVPAIPTPDSTEDNLEWQPFGAIPEKAYAWWRRLPSLYPRRKK